MVGAYLAATPNAPNVAAVNDSCRPADKEPGNLNRLIQTVQNMAGQTGDDKKEYVLASVARTWASAGDIAAA